MRISSEIKSTAVLVEDILERIPDTRNSDNLLFYHVLSKIGHEKGIDIEHMAMPSFLLKMRGLGFPSFETVRRTRQKIQHTRIDLQPCKNVSGYREINEDEYKSYALGVTECD